MRFRTVIYKEGVFIDKEEAATKSEARALCKQRLTEYPGAAIFDTRKAAYIEYYNAFPIDKVAQEYKATHKATPEYVKKSMLYPIYGYMFTKKMIEKGN